MIIEEMNMEYIKAQTRLLNAQAAEIEARLSGAPKKLSEDVPASRTNKTKVKTETLNSAPVVTTSAVPAGPTREQEEASKKLALDTASAFVRHFSKNDPDGMTRARAILADGFGGKKIAELNYHERLNFIETLKTAMESATAGVAS